MDGSQDFAEKLADIMLNPVREIGGHLAREVDELRARVTLLESAVRLLLREDQRASSWVGKTGDTCSAEPLASRKAPEEPTLRVVE